MKTLLKLEEAAIYLLSVYALFYLEASWWMFLLIFIGPDISMIGYLFGPRAGAFMYNLFHHKAVGAILIFLFLLLHNEAWLFAGIIIIGHSSMDRFFGYGLKYFSGFHYTHLGFIGKFQTNPE